MNQACPTEDELFLLLDGEATENRASELRAHLTRCAACREAWNALEELVKDIRAPVPDTPSPDAIARLMRRLETEPQARARALPQRRAPRWHLTVAGGGVLAAAAAAAALWIAPGAAERDPGGFTARGAPAASAQSSRPLRRNVGVAVHRTATRLDPLASGDTVAPETAYAVSYTNLGPAGSAYLMVFAVDSLGEVHWIQPEYLDPATDPSAIALDRATTAVVLPTAGVLASPAPGRLRIVTIVSEKPLHVSQVETLVAAGLHSSSLSAAFPDADVQEIPVILRSSVKK